MTAPTAENTGNVIADGTWQAVAGAGDVTISAATNYERVIRTSVPDESLKGHLENRTDLLLSGSQQVYVRGQVGLVIVVTAISPV